MHCMNCFKIPQGAKRHYTIDGRIILFFGFFVLSHFYTNMLTIMMVACSRIDMTFFAMQLKTVTIKIKGLRDLRCTTTHTHTYTNARTHTVIIALVLLLPVHSILHKCVCTPIHLYMHTSTYCKERERGRTLWLL